MALTPEWRRRIDNWRRELRNHFYRPLGEVDLSGFVTKEQLTAAEALKGEFEPMPHGTPWGAKWEYGWFRGVVQLTEEATGARIVLRIDIGAESAVYVNGVAAGAIDQQHETITLTRNGVAGTRYDILVEGYAGHGPRVAHAGPTPPGRETVPEPGPTQATVGNSSFGLWEEEVYQLWLDVETLYDVRDNVDQESLRVSEIDQGLRDFTLIVDFEQPYDKVLETVRTCREYLQPLLQCVNGSTTPVMFTFGHAHIDVAWLWPLAETERKCVRTLATQLALMEEYPEFRFLQSQPHLYHMVKCHYPELYARIKSAVQSGQLVPEGATWVEPDTNVPSGESLIRQFTHGKRFFRDEFGVECELLWLPDVFGYSGALPQIMRGCGVNYFSTQKIFWAYNGGEPFPYNTFVWEGIDGSEVIAHLHNDYNARTNPASLIRRWNERVQKDGISTRLFPFGYGDGGGGPTREHLEFLRREKDLEGVPEARMASPIEFFKDLEARRVPDARYVGELYFQAHRGTYTSQARTKRGNRKSELALREAEMWSVAATALKGVAYPYAALDQAWKTVLLNQFHDILPGSSIHRVYEEAEAAYASVINTAQQITDQAASSLTETTQALTVFNSLSWERVALMPLPKGFGGAVDADGAPLASQTVAGEQWAEVPLPPCGWTTLYPNDHADGRTQVLPKVLDAAERIVDNGILRVQFNSRGEIISIWDKEAGRELTAGVCNNLKMYRDVPTAWDAWDIDSMYERTPVELESPACIELVTSGRLVTKLRVTRTLHQSVMTQEITLRRDSRRIDFHTVIDWQESHKLLKVNFPVNVHANEAVHEIQFGYTRRPNHKSRPFDADRFEVSNHKWTALMEENRGCAVLNDCKYGVNVLGNSINLTLLKAALAPDMMADKGHQEFTYAFYAWNGPFSESEIVREAYDLNCPITSVPGSGGRHSLFSIHAANVILDTVKAADDGSGDFVMRLYEAKRMSTRCKLSTSLSVERAALTDMLENIQEIAPLSDGDIDLDFRPFEVKTLRLQIAPPGD
jgi:alpha-mannosidase